MFVFYILAVSYNQPKFCSNPTWNPNAITFTDNNTIGSKPLDIFISTNDTVYVPNGVNGRIVVWSAGSTTPTSEIPGNWRNSYGFFVTTSGDIYIDALTSINGVDRWTFNSTGSHLVMYTCNKCTDVFVDISNTLYCSMSNLHQVLAKSLHSALNNIKIVAGIGSRSSNANGLNKPFGIFVDINFDLYVADCGNNRVQLLISGQLTATTVAGSGSITPTISLDCPIAIILDADTNLFVIEHEKHRIIGPGPAGLQCIIGCPGGSSGGGSRSDQLQAPWSFSFDSAGNIFVSDRDNDRIQKFLLTSSLCRKFNNQSYS